MWPIMQKKVKILNFDYFLDFDEEKKIAKKNLNIGIRPKAH